MTDEPEDSFAVALTCIDGRIQGSTSRCERTEAGSCAHYPGRTVSGVSLDTGTGCVRVVTGPQTCAGATGPA